MSLRSAIDHASGPIGEAIERGLLPGAVLGAVDAAGDRVVFVAGNAQLEPDRVPMARGTVFDLASLTKPIFTTTVLLEHVASAAIGLEQPLSELIPDLRQHDLQAPERQLTIRECLTHRTFLPAVEPLYTLGLEPATLEAYVLQRSWQPGPPVYSDINFILLGILIERLSRSPLSEHVVPLGFTFTPAAECCAATEWCPWRRRMLRGEVHDENACAFGGAAGHAGLFGTIDATLDFGIALLQTAPDPRHPTQLLMRRETPDRTLGWQMSSPGWSGGELSSKRCIGHTGFTGTGLWVDFDLGIAWSLLTNRVHPSRHAPSVTLQLRPLVADRLNAEIRRSTER
ncbi:MAG: hypothetical protein QOD83_1409 [Solirubrobacteraceae bacterium]|jgi:CubicO group peptidase (beta-lactamase class C family)|nr:hypothetical protein [Solirubrobacteraceae bacterium]